ncbi:MAG: hypothetical protein ACI92B_001053 [Marinobacter maritimus]|jgi:hypothetical protein|tara:strand:- start:6 stop:287 length:282 start_codon:yes stop_codon:yes gene_type:complete
MLENTQRLKPKKMSEESGSARNKFRFHFAVEIILVAALAIYMVLAQGQVVGDDLAFTVIGAGLMALVTYWTLSTLRGGLEMIVLRVRGLKLKH